ncbi:MAG TPA: transcriptional regulator [Firmicutes bacterium]|nr:transcriptional regulator [Bacillota bacterium]
MLDATDFAIIDLLKKNARIGWRDIGEQVHLTGQAVGGRIRKMEELGLIKGYSAVLDDSKLGKAVTAFVTVYMKTTDHPEFHRFIKARSVVVEAHRISGDGCYLLKVKATSNEELNELLDALLKFGNYRVSLSIGTIKS